jgi:Bacteriophage protein GP30.3
MDIRSNGSYPGSDLSNFAPHRFWLDGVECGSMEGLLQSLKFEEVPLQAKTCKMVGKAAKGRGEACNETWKEQQVLWWQGKSMKRDGPEYQEFLDRAYEAMSEQSVSFRQALVASQEAILTHSIGKTVEAETVPTEEEFCSRLMRIRARLQSGSTAVDCRI